MIIRKFQDHVRLLPVFGPLLLLMAGMYYIQELGQLVSGLGAAKFAQVALDWGLRLLLGPLAWGGLIGCLNDYHARGEVPNLSRFRRHAVCFFPRFFSISLIMLLLALTIGIIYIVTTGRQPTPGWQFQLETGLLKLPLSMIKFYWQTAIVVDNFPLGRSLFRGFRTLFYSMPALAVSLAWAAVGMGDGLLLEGYKTWAPADYLPTLLALRSALLALAAVLSASYAIAIYRLTRVETFNELPGEPVSGEIPDAPRTAPGERLAGACFWLALFSFLPVINVAALVAGGRALKTMPRFSVRAFSALLLGGFFTLLYLLGLAGHYLPRRPAERPGLQFLVQADPTLQESVRQYEGANYPAALELIPDGQAATAGVPAWPRECLAGLIQLRNQQKDAAESAFNRALKSKPAPDRGEFYYFYGQVLLETEKFTDAGTAFATAQKLAPGLVHAGQLRSLAQNAVKPSATIVAVWSILSLLILFTVHEYAHAQSAWKLGDDTAMRQGRLTLNPVAHLDLIGSVLLPGILLFKQSSIVFGWAKPVPVNPANFANPRRDHMVVSFAGPAANVAVAMLCFLLLGLTALGLRLLAPEVEALNLSLPSGAVAISGGPAMQWVAGLVAFVKQLLFTSLVLGFFNLLPVPPLDGSWILSGILPEEGRGLFEKLRPFGLILFLILVLTPALDFLLAIPVGFAWGALHVYLMMLGFT